ncbi:hypothetical protein L1987_37822 [Smallanthus sonchifolius]|uniref:Uncharacterized protein n=1 Tax=Smallanthus sonchifolius TaxID=185202 RepID=A0ACB9HGZ4_9ASTR|nr:hypothetical protein L1987_37822 [Smallanthus sonchifolius]
MRVAIIFPAMPSPSRATPLSHPVLRHRIITTTAPHSHSLPSDIPGLSCLLPPRPPPRPPSSIPRRPSGGGGGGGGGYDGGSTTTPPPSFCVLFR